MSQEANIVDKNIASTGIRNGKLFCFNCGSGYPLTYPMPLNKFNEKVRAFEVLHKDCPKTWKEPEADINNTIEQRMKFWLEEGETGLSSKTIFSVIAGDKAWCIHPDQYSHPIDPDDFKRCYKLLKVIPEWKNELFKLKSISPVWAKLVDNWDKLTEMFEEQLRTNEENGMYEFMQSLGC